MATNTIRTKDGNIEFIASGTDKISCDGGSALGHPRVYYTFNGRKEFSCEYCGKIFSHQKPAIKK